MFSDTRSAINDTYSVKGGATGSRPKPQGVELLFSPTPYSRTVSVGRDSSSVFSGMLRKFVPPGVYAYKRGLLSSTGYGSFGFGRPTVVLSEPTTDSALLQKIKHERVNLAMMMVEYRKTAAMFSDIAQLLLDVNRNIRRGRLRSGLASGLKGVPSTWLLYRYGITPALMETKGALDTIIGASDHPLVRRVSVVDRRHASGFDTKKYQPDGNWVVLSRRMNWTRSQIVKRVAYVEYTQPELALAAQLGLTNPLLLAWEVIPYSFVMDWFINIGDYLANIDALQGIARISACRITKRTSQEVWPNGGRGTLNSYTREPFEPSNSFPRWEPSISAKRCADAVALFHNMLRK